MGACKYYVSQRNGRRDQDLFYRLGIWDHIPRRAAARARQGTSHTYSITGSGIFNCFWRNLRAWEYLSQPCVHYTYGVLVTLLYYTTCCFDHAITPHHLEHRAWPSSAAGTKLTSSIMLTGEYLISFPGRTGRRRLMRAFRSAEREDRCRLLMDIFCHPLIMLRLGYAVSVTITRAARQPPGPCSNREVCST